MKIPKSIRIGGVDYAVVDKPALNNGKKMCYGKIDYEKSIIELNPDNQNHQKKCMTLWHEIIHGVIEHTNMDMKSSDEEGIVDTVAKGIYQVLQDNKGAFFDLTGSNDA
jgi:protein tyrosine phosphatase